MKHLFTLIIFLTATPLVFNSAIAQSLPLPPPFPDDGGSEEPRIAQNDRVPPKIEVITEHLQAGKNVFSVRITDDSSLRVREVRYVQDGEIITQGLLRDQDNIYKALVEIEPPSRIVVVTAGDAAGNIASSYREYDVSYSKDLFGEILDMLRRVPVFFQSIIDRIAGHWQTI
ncbi:MAG TPA: hypothetical protein VLA68_00470 [Nitrososphaera sp.]|nr:hypothetical protein [Nitrososphaera sp.]